MKRTLLITLFLFTSASALGYSLYSFEKFNFTAGKQQPAPSRLPASANATSLSTGEATLFVFVHPECTCTHATLKELAKIHERLGAKLAIKVIMAVDDAESEQSVAQSESQIRHAISTVTIVRDTGSKIAHSMGAETSGQTILYSAEGKLLFQGGITESRAHEGDNAGEDAIIRLVSTPAPDPQLVSKTATFGCKL